MKNKQSPACGFDINTVSPPLLQYTPKKAKSSQIFERSRFGGLNDSKAENAVKRILPFPMGIDSALFFTGKMAAENMDS